MAEQVIIAGSGWTNLVKATSGGELLITGSIIDKLGATALRQTFQEDISNQILTELRILNSHMELINSEKINEEDIRR